MKVTKEIDYQVSLKAILNEDGGLRLSISAVAPYGNRTATASIDDFSEETLATVQRVLGKVLEEEGQRAVLLAEKAAATSHAAAIAMGEEI